MKYSFSIIITHYNLPSMAITAINSVVQSLNNAIIANSKLKFEVIVVDAGSTSKNLTEIKNYIKTNNIQLIHGKGQLKLLKARKEGLKVSKYKYIFFLDGDDLIDEKFFIKTIECIDKYPEVDIIRNNKICFNDSGLWQENYYKLKKIGNGYLSKEELINLSNVSMNNIYRKKYLVNALKFFAGNLINFEDALFYFFCVIYFEPKLIESEESVYYYRRHPQSFMTQAFKKGFNIKSYKLIIDSFLVNLQFLLSTRLIYTKKIIDYFLLDYSLFIKRKNILINILFFFKIKKINRLARKLKKLNSLLNELKM